MAKSKRKPLGLRAPMAQVFVYCVGFETLPSRVVIQGAARGVRKNSLIFRVPSPIRTNEQLRDIEHRIGAASDPPDEVIITSVSFLEDYLVALTPEQVESLRGQRDALRKEQEAMGKIREGVEEVMEEVEAMGEAPGPRLVKES